MSQNVLFYSIKPFEKSRLIDCNRGKHTLFFTDNTLQLSTVVQVKDFPVISCFVTDQLDRDMLERLARGGTRFIALRSAGFDHIDLQVAKEYGLKVAYVPAYSPEAIAEFAVGLILALSRKTIQAHQQVHYCICQLFPITLVAGQQFLIFAYFSMPYLIASIKVYW